MWSPHDEDSGPAVVLETTHVKAFRVFLPFLSRCTYVTQLYFLFRAGGGDIFLFSADKPVTLHNCLQTHLTFAFSDERPQWICYAVVLSLTPHHPPDLPSSHSYSVSPDRSCRRSSGRRKTHMIIIRDNLTRMTPADKTSFAVSWNYACIIGFFLRATAADRERCFKGPRGGSGVRTST